MTLINKIETPDKTWIALEQDSKLSEFLKEYMSLLKRKLQVVEVGGPKGYSYYTCGPNHDPRNPEWERLKVLSQLCKKYDYDFFIVKEIIEGSVGRKLTCEGQILNNQKAIRRRHLESGFGVDFGEPGSRELEVL